MVSSMLFRGMGPSNSNTKKRLHVSSSNSDDSEPVVSHGHAAHNDNDDPSLVSSTSTNLLSRASSTASVVSNVASEPLSEAAKDKRNRVAFEKRYDCVNESPEEILGESENLPSTGQHVLTIVSTAKQRKTWTSKYYGHFRAPTILDKGNGIVIYQWLCPKDGCVLSLDHHAPGTYADLSQFYQLDCGVASTLGPCNVQSETPCTGL